MHKEGKPQQRERNTTTKPCKLLNGYFQERDTTKNASVEDRQDVEKYGQEEREEDHFDESNKDCVADNNLLPAKFSV